MDISWKIPSIGFYVISEESQLYCFCRKKAVIRDDNVTCPDDVCGFEFPGTDAIEYYVEDVLCRILKIPFTENLITQGKIVYLIPRCHCRQVLDLRIWPVQAGGYFWNARYRLAYKFDEYKEQVRFVMNKKMAVAG